MPLFGPSRRATLRITSGRPNQQVRFDAMLTLGRRHLRVQCITAEQTPFEVELPDVDLSAVVRAHSVTDSLIVEYVVEKGDERRLYGQSRLPLAILERRASGILVGGLPAPAIDAPAVKRIVAADSRLRRRAPRAIV